MEEGILAAALVFAIAATIALCGGPARAADCVSQTAAAMESGRLETAVPALREGAREGDERCKFILAIWSLSGTAMAQDLVAGSRWLREAAEAGLPVAQANLGVLYASGIGVSKDEKEAAKWYRWAAEQGDPLGQVSLGAVTFLGAGVPKDRIEAYVWTNLAAAQGNERARAHLPVMKRAMTPDEIEQAESRVAEFRPPERSVESRANRLNALRAFGLSGEPTEYERLFGY